MAISHDPIDVTISNPPARPAPRVAENVSIYPPQPSNGGSVAITGTGVDRRVTNESGPYKVEVPRVRRDV
jgi:hypothetical protein